MKLFLIFFISFIASLAARAEDALAAQADWNRGNNFYAHHQYDSATAAFERIAAGNVADYAVYYNLGNACYRQNEIGKSILNYQRALLRKPGNAQVTENLLLAQSRIPNRIQPVNDVFFISWLHAVTVPAYSFHWAIAALVFFLLALGFLATGRFKSLGIRVQVTGSLIFLCCACLTFSFLAAQNAIGGSTAVLLQDATFRPDASVKSIKEILVPEGTTVSVMNAATGSVTLPDGRNGHINPALLAAVY